MLPVPCYHSFLGFIIPHIISKVNIFYAKTNRFDTKSVNIVNTQVHHAILTERSKSKYD